MRMGLGDGLTLAGKVSVFQKIVNNVIFDAPLYEIELGDGRLNFFGRSTIWDLVVKFFCSTKGIEQSFTVPIKT